MHTTVTNTSRTCLLCERPVKGRSDKKFCDDNCRNIYNSKQGDDDNPVKYINSILKRNRSILMHVTANESVVTVDKRELMQMDYNFNYFTHIQKAKQCIIYHCYDYAIKTSRNACIIAKK